MKILTLTLNPALDISATAPRIQPEAKLRCSSPRYNPGGGGINVSRVIRRLGGESLAVFTSGGYTGRRLEDLLTQEGVHFNAVAVNGETRESLSVTDVSTNLQYRFGFPGEPLSEKDLKNCLDALKKEMAKPDFLVASGSLPPGAPVDFFAQVAALAWKTNTRFILDTSGEPLRAALEAGVFLAKPNLGELAALHGKTDISDDEQEALATHFIEQKKAEIVVVSLGARGAMLASKEGLLYATPPVVPRKSTVGAGDSMVAGMAFALAHGKTPAEVLRWGVACGTATTMREGTELCRREDVERLMGLVRI